MSNDKSEREVNAVETERPPFLLWATAMKTPKVAAGVRNNDILPMAVISLSPTNKCFALRLVVCQNAPGAW